MAIFYPRGIGRVLYPGTVSYAECSMDNAHLVDSFDSPTRTVRFPRWLIGNCKFLTMSGDINIMVMRCARCDATDSTSQFHNLVHDHGVEGQRGHTADNTTTVDTQCKCRHAPRDVPQGITKISHIRREVRGVVSALSCSWRMARLHGDLHGDLQGDLHGETSMARPPSSARVLGPARKPPIGPTTRIATQPLDPTPLFVCAYSKPSANPRLHHECALARLQALIASSCALTDSPTCTAPATAPMDCTCLVSC